MELGKPSIVSVVLSILVLGLIVYLSMQATKKTDTTDYSKGAVHNESSTNISPVANYYPLSIPGCSPFVRLDAPSGTPVPKAKEVKK